jgi:hypothetical protein
MPLASPDVLVEIAEPFGFVGAADPGWMTGFAACEAVPFDGAALLPDAVFGVYVATLPVATLPFVSTLPCIPAPTPS